MKFFSDNRGTALLTALLIMGVFIAISLALSTLVVRELRVTRDMLDAGKAYYAAESGVEEALYHLDKNLPGWHDESEKIDLGDDVNFEYVVKNTCNVYPCLDDEEYDLSGVPLSAYYDVLELNETTTIPLFTVDEDGNVQSVKDFTVEFFAGFNPAEDLKIQNTSSWDVLRWKVFGMKNTADHGYTTDSIDDFTAVAAGHTASGEEVYAGAERPSWFGSVDCDEQNSNDRINNNIKCEPYAVADGTAKAGSYRPCTNTEARDYYFYVGGEVDSVKACYPISDFMGNHQEGFEGATGLNYLSLTNMMNPAVFKDAIMGESELAAKSRIYFRVETYGDEVVRQVADITTSGYSGKSKQSLNVQMERDSYIPVFNFSVYSTYKKPEINASVK